MTAGFCFRLCTDMVHRVVSVAGYAAFLCLGVMAWSLNWFSHSQRNEKEEGG